MNGCDGGIHQNASSFIIGWKDYSFQRWEFVLYTTETYFSSIMVSWEFKAVIRKLIGSRQQIRERLGGTVSPGCSEEMRITCAVCGCCLSPLNMINTSGFYNNPSKGAGLWIHFVRCGEVTSLPKGTRLVLVQSQDANQLFQSQDNTLDSCTTWGHGLKKPLSVSMKSLLTKPAALGPFAACTSESPARRNLLPCELLTVKTCLGLE